jgi:rRNA maturation endonuclease Nob1
MNIPLISAAYCLDCDSIVDKLDCCPACGSRALLCLARVLNRQEVAA